MIHNDPGPQKLEMQNFWQQANLYSDLLQRDSWTAQDSKQSNGDLAFLYPWNANMEDPFFPHASLKLKNTNCPYQEW